MKAHGIVGALDEIVWAVNPRHDTVESLADYIAGFAAEFLESAGIALRLDIPRKMPALALNAEHRYNLFLAIREALNNAVKHAAATEVRLRLALDDEILTVAVEDNGHGISAEGSELAEGLRNMQERMARIGGKCDIETGESKGTSVSFLLPMARKRR